MVEHVIVKENKFNARRCARQDNIELAERQDTIGVWTHIMVV